MYKSQETGCIDHDKQIVSIGEQCVELLGKMQRFRDQGTTLHLLAEHHMCVSARGSREERQAAVRAFSRSRDVAAQHGFFCIESKACHGLENMATVEVDMGEAVTMFRNALVAEQLGEEGDSTFIIHILESLCGALLKTKGNVELAGGMVLPH